MRRLLLLIFLISSTSFTQVKSFNYSDSIFTVGQELNLDIRFTSARVIVDSLTLGRMDSLATFIISHPNLTLELGVNNDCRGDSIYNLKLAEFRSLSLKNWLVGVGADENQLITRSNGERTPATLYSNNQFIYNRLPEKFQKTESYLLSEPFINQFKSDHKLFEDLHMLNRRTIIRIVSVQ